jgi:hypothetical protein
MLFALGSEESPSLMKGTRHQNVSFSHQSVCVTGDLIYPVNANLFSTRANGNEKASANTPLSDLPLSSVKTSTTRVTQTTAITAGYVGPMKLEMSEDNISSYEGDENDENMPQPAPSKGKVKSHGRKQIISDDDEPEWSSQTSTVPAQKRTPLGTRTVEQMSPVDKNRGAPRVIQDIFSPNVKTSSRGKHVAYEEEEEAEENDENVAPPVMRNLAEKLESAKKIRESGAAQSKHR